MCKVLVVDPENATRKELVRVAMANEMQPLEALCGKEAIKWMHAEAVDICVVDVELPDMDGFKLCRDICSRKNVPILIYTNHGDEFIKLFAYNQLGVSDYVVKPCSAQEVLARLRVILRYRQRDNGAQCNGIYRTKGIAVDMRTHTLYVDNNKIELKAKEYELLACMIKHTPQILSRELILREVWGYDFYGSDRTVDTHVNRLRDRLGPYRGYIVTSHRVGYRFDPDAVPV